MPLIYIFFWCLISHVNSLTRTDELKDATEIVKNIDRIFSNNSTKIFNDSDDDIMVKMQSIVGIIDCMMYQSRIQII